MVAFEGCMFERLCMSLSVLTQSPEETAYQAQEQKCPDLFKALLGSWQDTAVQQLLVEFLPCECGHGQDLEERGDNGYHGRWVRCDGPSPRASTQIYSKLQLSLPGCPVLYHMPLFVLGHRIRV